MREEKTKLTKDDVRSIGVQVVKLAREESREIRKRPLLDRELVGIVNSYERRMTLTFS